MSSLRRMLPLLLLALVSDAAADVLVVEPAADATLYQPFSGDPETADSQGPHLFVGRIAQGTRRRALLRFDLTALPADATIDSAQLELTVTRTVSGALSVGVHRVQTSRQEGSANAGTPGGQGTTPGANDPTWTLSAFPATPWTTAGGDFVATASGAVTLDAVGDYVFAASAGMLADLTDWQANPAGNLGWILLGDEAQSPPNAKRLESVEAINAATHPRLRINYTPAVVQQTPTIPIPVAAPAAWLALAVLIGLVALRSHRPRDGAR